MFRVPAPPAPAASQNMNNARKLPPQPAVHILRRGNPKYGDLGGGDGGAARVRMSQALRGGGGGGGRVGPALNMGLVLRAHAGQHPHVAGVVADCEVCGCLPPLVGPGTTAPPTPTAAHLDGRRTHGHTHSAVPEDGAADEAWCGCGPCKEHGCTRTPAYTAGIRSGKIVSVNGWKLTPAGLRTRAVPQRLADVHATSRSPPPRWGSF